MTWRWPGVTRMTSAQSDSLRADLAQLVLSVARKIQARESPDSSVIQLSALESLVMRHIGQNPAITPRSLGRQLGLQRSNTSTTLRALESKGLITREVDPVDRREIRIRATQLARRNLEVVRAGWSDLIRPLLPANEQLRVAVDLLTDLDETLNLD